MLNIDIATKIIKPTQKIWLVHAGKGKRYYKIFKSRELVFLDMPGLYLTHGAFNSVESVRRHIRMHKAIRKYYAANDEINAPSRNAASYSGEPDDDIKGDVGNVVSLYKTAAIGDLVIVTGHGSYEPVLMGEIISDFDINDEITLEDKSYAPVQFRRVKWVSTKYAKRDFERELAETRLVNRKAVINIERNPVNEQLYKYAYNSFIIANDVGYGLSKADFFGKRYSGNDPRATRSSIDLISYFEAAFTAISRDELEAFSRASIIEAIERWQDPDLIYSFSQEFNSPGKFRLLTASAVFLGFLVIGVSVFTSNSASEFQNGVQIQNTEGIVDPSYREACEKVQELLNSIGQDNLCKLTELGNDARNKIGLETQARVTRGSVER